jgi:hypothetical protein
MANEEQPSDSTLIKPVDALKWLLSLIDQVQLTGTVDQVDHQVKLARSAKRFLTVAINDRED